MPTTIVRAPGIEERAERLYMGIRVQTPMKGMSATTGRLIAELKGWFAEREVEQDGPPFLRLHVIDMAGTMDIEVGLPVVTALPDDGRVRAGTLPAGRYASLVYTGNGIRGNGALLDWGRANGLTWDRWDDPGGDAFRCRYETFFTDPKVEPRKTRWETEVAIRLVD